MTTKVKVGGKLYEKCPEDGCTIIDEKFYNEISKYILSWTNEGYVKILHWVS